MHKIFLQATIAITTIVLAKLILNNPRVSSQQTSPSLGLTSREEGDEEEDACAALLAIIREERHRQSQPPPRVGVFSQPGMQHYGFKEMGEGR